MDDTVPSSSGESRRRLDETGTESDAIRLAQLSADRFSNSVGGEAIDDRVNTAGVAELTAALAMLGSDAILSQHGASDPPLRLGRFEILGERGRGGFGIVLRAYDPLLQREVALKLPLPERLIAGQSPGDFVREAQIAARLEHQGIVRVYEARRLGPVWYIASAYCAGPTLAAWRHSLQVPPAPRITAEIVADVADAVHYAHSRGILHLDLKPDNILLETAEEDVDKPRSLVTDFGLAGVSDGVSTRMRRIGGTLAYMAPEQRSGDSNRIGIAADVYALGAILHELLNGPRDLGGTDVDAESSSEASAPPPLSPVLPTTPRDLDAVCRKCLREDPGERYRSAQEVKEDLQRFLQGQGVTARTANWPERLRRWCTYRPVTASLAAGLLLSGIVGAIGIAWQWRRAQDHLSETRALLYAADMKLADVAWDERNIRSVDALLTPYESPHRPADDLRGWEWHYYHKLCHQELKTFAAADSIECSAVVSPETTLVVGTATGKLAAFDVSSGVRRWTLEGFPSHVAAVACSSDGRRIAAVDRTGLLKVWGPVKSPQLIDARKLPWGAVRSAAFDDGLERLAVSDGDFRIHCWDMDSSQAVATFAGHASAVTSLAFSLDENQLLSGSEDGSVWLWSFKTGQPTFVAEHPDRRWILSVAIDPSGRWIAAGAQDGKVLAWEAGQSKPLFIRHNHTNVVHKVQFSPTNDHLLSASGDRSIRVWSFPEGEPVCEFWGHEELATSMIADSTAKQVVSTGRDGNVKVWNFEQSEFEQPRPLRKDVGNASFSGDGRTLALRFRDGRVSVHQWPDMRELYQFQGPPALTAFAYDGDRQLCAMSRLDGAIEVWREGRRLHTLARHSQAVRKLAFDPVGNRLAAGGNDRAVSVWDPIKGSLIQYVERQEREILGVALHPTDPLVAVSVDHLIKMIDARSGRLLGALDGHRSRVYDVRFSHDGAILAAGDRSGAVIVWDVKRELPRVKLLGHTDRVYSCLFTSDCRRLVSCSRDQTIRWWDLTTGRELCQISGDWGPLEGLALSPDGWTLLAIGEDGALRMWDPRPASEHAAAGAE